MIGSAEAGFLYTLMKLVPGLVAGISYSGQKFAGFVILITFAYLIFLWCVCITGGFLGAGMVGIGIALRYFATTNGESSNAESSIRLQIETPMQSSNVREPPAQPHGQK
jgi:hypothetical protein